MRFVVRREDTGLFLTPRSYGCSGWSNDLQQARVFNGKSPATNATRNALSAGRRYRTQDSLPAFAVLPVEMTLKD